MTKRLFYLAVGIGLGAVIARRLTRAASRLTPRGLADQTKMGWRGLEDAIRAFVDDVKAAMAERETELREALTEEGTRGEEPWSQRR